MGHSTNFYTWSVIFSLTALILKFSKNYKGTHYKKCLYKGTKLARRRTDRQTDILYCPPRTPGAKAHSHGKNKKDNQVCPQVCSSNIVFVRCMLRRNTRNKTKYTQLRLTHIEICRKRQNDTVKLNLDGPPNRIYSVAVIVTIIYPSFNI